MFSYPSQVSCDWFPNYVPSLFSSVVWGTCLPISVFKSFNVWSSFHCVGCAVGGLDFVRWKYRVVAVSIGVLRGHQPYPTASCLALNRSLSMKKWWSGWDGSITLRVCLFILFFDYLWIVVIASSIKVPGDGWCSRSNILAKALLDAELFLCQVYYEYLSIHYDF